MGKDINVEKFGQSMALECLEKYKLSERPLKVISFGQGHIHDTFRVICANHPGYILQRINTSIFKEVNILSDNLKVINDCLESNQYPALIRRAVQTQTGEALFKDRSGDYWRLLPFVKGQCLDYPENEQQLKLTANAFGTFASFLNKINPKEIKPSIPDFHNTSKRFLAFEKTLEADRFNRAISAKEMIDFLLSEAPQYLSFFQNDIPKRIIHNDAKLSNLIITENTYCVIDLDTVMSGYLAFDFGDILRSNCCPAKEDEQDVSKIKINKNFVQTLRLSYINSLKAIITHKEKDTLMEGASTLIFEQALRFLTDYLDGDKYYPVDYDTHNLIRARNQIILLKALSEIC